MSQAIIDWLIENVILFNMSLKDYMKLIRRGFVESLELNKSILKCDLQASSVRISSINLRSQQLWLSSFVNTPTDSSTYWLELKLKYSVTDWKTRLKCLCEDRWDQILYQ